MAVSSQLSQAVYFVSIIGLSLMLARPVYLVYSGAQERGAEALAAGLGAMVDSMSPGTTVVTSLESYPGVKLSVAFSGTTIVASFGNSSASAQVAWALQRATLSPGQDYRLTLEGGEVQVAQARDG